MRTALTALALVLAGCGQQPAGAPASSPSQAATPGPLRASPAIKKLPVLPTDVAAIAGTWRVDGVAPMPGGVQAFAADDPAYMHAQIRVTNSDIAWIAAPRPDANMRDRCTGPVIQRSDKAAHASFLASHRAQLTAFGMGDAVSYEVACLDGGEWGPEGAMVSDNKGRIAFVWYDGIMLRFVR
jgi:hypothetical protein